MVSGNVGNIGTTGALLPFGSVINSTVLPFANGSPLSDPLITNGTSEVPVTPVPVPGQNN